MCHHAVLAGSPQDGALRCDKAGTGKDSSQIVVLHSDYLQNSLEFLLLPVAALPREHLPGLRGAFDLSAADSENLRTAPVE